MREGSGSGKSQAAPAGLPAGAAGAGSATLAIRLLGGFGVSVQGRPVPDEAWRGQKARNVVKLLALAPGGRLARDQVLDILWPDFSPEAAVANLYTTLTIVRKALVAPAALRLQGGVLSLEPAGSLAIDVEAFRAAALAARDSSDPAPYEAALARYGGTLLPDDRREDWTVAPREALRGTWHGLLRAVAPLHDARDNRPAAIAALRQLVADDPLDEAAHAGLMRLYALIGQRALALRQFEGLRDALARDLDIEPGAATRRLNGDIATGRFPSPSPATPAAASPPAPPAAADQLPVPLTSFVGRERELAEIVALFEGGRRKADFRLPPLVTLTGIGGSGKTRLAVAAARALRGEFPDGVWFVGLAALAPDEGQAAPVAEAVAAAIGVREQPGQGLATTIVAALRARSALLVLDNCEQVIDAAAALAAAILAGCPGIRILATSREALRLPGEVAWRVPPLALPQVADERGPAASLVALGQVPAVALFVDRVCQRQPGLALTAENAPAIVAICRRLEGLPLALELAAARTTILSVAQLAARLGDALGTLATRDRAIPARQQTLRATMDWSYHLLTPAEQTLFRRLAAFAGTWSLAAAEAVCAEVRSEKVEVRGSSDEEANFSLRTSDFSLLDALEALAEKSLVQVEPGDGETWYRLLEPIRQYAAERLTAEEADAVRRRHASYYLALAEGVAEDLRGPESGTWMARLVPEEDNLRAALGWLRGCGAAEEGLRLCRALWRYWQGRGQIGESRRWLDAVLDLAGADDAPAVSPPVRIRALFVAGWFAMDQGDFVRAAALAVRSLSLARAHDDPAGIAEALIILGFERFSAADYATARRHYLEILALQHGPRTRWAEAGAHYGLGLVTADAGDLGAARAHFDAAAARARAMGDLERAALSLDARGRLEHEAGEPDVAQATLAEGLALARASGARTAEARCLAGLGAIAVERGELRLAREQLARALESYAETGSWMAIRLCLTSFAALAAAVGDAPRALRLIGAVTARDAALGIRSRRSWQEHTARSIATARAALGETAGAAFQAEGATLTPESAIGEALALTVG